MSDEDCEATLPNRPDVVCQKGEHPWGAHINMDAGVSWPGNPMPERPKKARGDQSRLAGIQRAIDEYGHGNTKTGPPTVQQGPPVQAVRSWSERREQWLTEAKAALLRVCESQETFTTGNVWALVDDTPERRAMVLVVRHGLRLGWMHEESAMRMHDDWRTRDGVSFPLNKLVPIYRSDLHG